MGAAVGEPQEQVGLSPRMTCDPDIYGVAWRAGVMTQGETLQALEVLGSKMQDVMLRHPG